MIDFVQDLANGADVDDPVLVLALSGWVDAGSAGEGASQYLADRLDDASTLARVDLDDIADLQQSRPAVQLVEGVTRELEWPEITFTSGHAGVDVVVGRGPEPSVRWRAFAAEIVDMAKQLGVSRVVTLGGMPSPVSHRRPIQVLSTATSRSVAQEVEPVRLDYTGPTGAQTAVQVAAGSAGIPGIGLWAQVPHYLSGTVSPPAIRALISRLREIAGVECDLRLLDEQSVSYDRQVEETVQSRDDLSQLVEQLEAESPDLPSGEELVSEIEEFLRDEN